MLSGIRALVQQKLKAGVASCAGLNWEGPGVLYEASIFTEICVQ
jgi:hypothetical protein